MSIFDRTSLMKIHMALAAFILPVAFMFLLTGGLYTWGIKGDYHDSSIDLALEQPLVADKAVLHDLVSKELDQRGIGFPSGNAGVKLGGTSFRFEWTGANRDVVLEPTADPLLAKMQVKETSWYRQFVQLHKAKGGTAFKVYAAVLAVSLFALLFSGFILAWQLVKYRKLTAISTGAGIAVFIGMVLSG